MKIDPLGQARSNSNAEYIQHIKSWTRAALQIDEDISLLVSELRCTEEGCPPIETVIAVLEIPDKPVQFKIHKAMKDVLYDDVRTAIQKTHNH